MTEQEVDRLTNELVSELVCYNKIKISVKNIWAERLIRFFSREKLDYNPLQHAKVMKIIPRLVVDDGISGLLEVLDQVDNTREDNKIEDKTEDLSSSEVKAQWAIDFRSMNPREKINKCVAWLTCGSPECSIPKFVMSHIETLDDENKKEMRVNYQIGRDKWNSISGSNFTSGVNYGSS